MTVKKFKEIVNNIDSKYDNEEVLTENKEYNEYCLGSSIVKLKGVELWHIDYFNQDKGGFYIALED